MKTVLLDWPVGFRSICSVLSFTFNLTFLSCVITQVNKNKCESSGKNNEVSCLRRSLGLLDASFFNDKQVTLFTCAFGVSILPDDD